MIYPLVKLYIAIAVLFFLPGYFFILALLGKKKMPVSLLERYVLSFGLSIVIVDALVLFLKFLAVPINTSSVCVSLVVFSLLCIILSKRSPLVSQKKDKDSPDDSSLLSLRSWSYRSIFIFLIILIFAVSLRGFYISRGIMPQTTDLGHHMYWSKHITTFSEIPDYGMPDFIIGEHIIFAATSMLSGLPFVSTMPVTILLLINIFSLLAAFILSFRFAEIFFGKAQAKKASLFAFLVISLFYAISDPQSKFVSGGVIGNLLGNLFIPLVLYCLLQVVRKRDPFFAQLLILFSAGIAYTHHLSTFVLLYVLAGAFLGGISLMIFVYRRNLKDLFKEVKLVAAPFLCAKTLTFIVTVVFFVLLVHTPSYLNPSAIDTAVGVPIKDTRTGLTINNIASNAGSWRFFYSIIGSLLFVFFVFPKKIHKEKKEDLPFSVFGGFLLLVWGGMIFLMSWQPALLRIDIPSGRIVSYITYPLAILGAMGAYFLLKSSKENFSKFIYGTVAFVVLGTGFVSGLSDVSDAARNRDPLQEKKVNQTYLASVYLEDISQKDQQVLKDHIYLEGDTWIKLFFMRGYKYPLSRSFLKRYEDIAKDRETCTRDMVAIPDSEIAKDCFGQTNVAYIMLNPGKDTAQFEKSSNFNQIYVSEHVVIFERIN